MGTWAVVVLPALVGWVSAPQSSVSWSTAVAVASGIWFLGHGQSIGGGGLAVSVVPLLLLAAFVLLARRALRRLLAAERAGARPSEWDAVLVRLVPGFLLGYAAVAVLVGLTTLAGPVRPGPAGVLGALLVPVAATATVLLRHGPEQPTRLGRRLLERCPGGVRDVWEGQPWLPAAWRAGWRGAGVLLALGLALAVSRIAASLPDIARIHGEYDLNVGAAAVLVAAQLLTLGNLATWGVSFIAGPGFSLATGGAISPAGAHPGLMPLVPVLGALPDEASYPRALFLVVLLPVGVGVLVGWWTDRRSPDGASVRERFAAAGAAGACSVVLVGVLTALGNGSVGVERLRAVGPTVGPMVGALLLEVVAGAAAWVGYRVWRQRRAVRPEDADGAQQRQSVVSG
ncbi:MAG TPA: DUF6350 family protein [Intrasporangium sp.]|uniref:cell division protein PerM n=1 Tax=Intrasporangium sp. TaxID=1925024 RepID=UPI002D76EEFF|nr:DUF6350 family protein [Intrasporangium sp.]HET7398238.1 DUF6350 family protein [Intrasporangium sp.]